MGSVGNVDTQHTTQAMSSPKPTFVKGGKEHWRVIAKARSPSAVAISWTKISKAKKFSNKLKLLDQADVGLAVLRERVMFEEAQKKTTSGRAATRQTSLAFPVANSNGAGPSGVPPSKKPSAHREKFDSRRLSPRLSAKNGGGDGSSSAHAMCFDVSSDEESPVRKMKL